MKFVPIRVKLKLLLFLMIYCGRHSFITAFEILQGSVLNLALFSEKDRSLLDQPKKTEANEQGNNRKEKQKCRYCEIVIDARVTNIQLGINEDNFSSFSLQL